MTDLEKIITDPFILAEAMGMTDLVPIHKTWLFWALDYEDKRPLMAHRDSYKTSVVIVLACVYVAFFYPNLNTTLARKTDGMAKDVYNTIISHLESDNLRYIHKKIFGEYDIIKKYNQDGLELKRKTILTVDKNLTYTGIGSAKTGTHPHIIRADDISNSDDRYYSGVREKTKQAYLDFINQATVGIKVTGTPWHKDDIFSILEKPYKFPVEKNFIKKFTPEFIEQRKKDIGNNSLYTANYRLIHISNEEAYFKNIKYIDKVPEMRLFSYLDPAFTNEGDGSVLVTAGIYKEMIIIKYGIVWRSTLDISYNRIESHFKGTLSTKLYNEANVAQVAISIEMRKRGIIVEDVYNNKNKFMRITDNVFANWENIYFAKTVSKDFMQQLEDFVMPIDISKKPPYPVDVPDALAGIVGKLTKKSWEVGKL